MIGSCRWPATLALVWCLAPLSAAQAPKDPAFDVASVKPNTSGEEESAAYTQPGGRYTATNVTVRSLVKSAYGLHDDQVVGGPSWMNTERFDIAARADGYATASAFRDAARLMLRPLLADRFKLATRSERRQLPVYALSLVRSDGRLGPKLRRFDPNDCAGPAKAMPPVPAALEEQIGVRLRGQRGSVDVLVVESLDRPQPD